MRVVLVQPQGQVGGHQSSSTLNLTQALLGAGHELTVISRNGFRDGWEQSLPVTHIPVGQLPDTMRVSRRLRNRKLINHYELWKIFDYAFALAAKDPDTVVHILDFEPLTLSVAYLRHGRPPCVLTVGTADLTFATVQGAWAKKALVSVGGRALSNVIDKMFLVFHSDRIMKLALERRIIPNATHSRIIPSGMDVRPRSLKNREWARRQLGLPLDVKIGVSFGPVRAVKGVDLLIEALSRLPRGQFKLIVAGTFEHSPEFDPISYALEKGCADDIHFIPRFVSKDEMDVIFSAADAVLLPYRSYFQGQSDLLLSACEYNLPVIASDVGDLGQRVRANGLGFLCRADDVGALCAVLKEFISSPDSLLNEIKVNVETYAHSRPWSVVAKELTALYSDAQMQM